MATELVQREIDFIQIPKAAIESFGGMSWQTARVRAEAGEDGATYFRMPIGYATFQRDVPNWTPPVSVNPKTNAVTPLRYLPTGCAWLREVDNRAFLYLQNW